MGGVKKRDINLFKAAGGERAKSKRRPMSTYLVMILAVVIIGVIGAIVYLNYSISNLEDEYQAQLNRQSNYNITVAAIEDLQSEYQLVVSEIYQAQRIEQYLSLRSSRYTKPTENEIAAIENSITSFNYTLDVDLVENGAAFLESLNKTDVNYDTLYGALSYLIEKEQSNRRDTIWYDYFRGQMVIVFAGGQVTGVNLSELANSLYNGILYEGITYEPFMDVILNGTKYVDARYMAVGIDSETVYNVMLLTTKTVEERAIDTLEESASRLFLEAVISGSVEDFQYEINEISYNNLEGTITVEITMVESSDFTIKDLCDDLDANVFFDVSSEVVSPPVSGEKMVPIILEISGAYLIEQE